MIPHFVDYGLSNDISQSILLYIVIALNWDFAIVMTALAARWLVSSHTIASLLFVVNM